MEQKRLSENIKPYDEVIIEALIEAKEKESKAEKAVINAGIIFLSILVLGIIYVVFRLTTVAVISSYLTFILSDAFILVWLCLLFLSFFNVQMKSKTFEKKEKDFEELKEDVIDRSPDIWNTPSLEEKRIQSYHELKEKYDINLYYK